MEHARLAAMISTVYSTECSDPPADGPLTAAERGELVRAHDRGRAVRKAAAVATFNGWATAFVATLSAPFALFSTFGLITTIVLVVVAAIEFRGRRRLLRFDPTGATLLGWNQLGLLAMITAYCLWSLYSDLYGANSIRAELQSFSELNSALGSSESVDTLVRQLTILLYGSIIALSVVFQGLTAAYYFTRRKYVTAYLVETPEWVRDLRRATM
jgi:hypothetical protein